MASLSSALRGIKRLTLFELLFLFGTLTSVVNGLRVPGFGLGISELTYLLAFGALIAERIYQRAALKKWLPWHPFWITSLLLVLGGFFSSLIARDFLAGMFVTFKAMFVFSIWISMAIVMVTERHREVAIVIAACIGPVFSAAISIWDVMTFLAWGPRIALFFGNSDSLVLLEDTGRLYGRFSGITSHPNIQSEYLITIVPLVLVGALFAWRGGNWKRGAVLTVFFVVLVWGDILAGSVTGMLCVALTVAIALGVGWLRNFPQTVVPAVAVVSAVALLGIVLLNFGGVDVTAIAGRLSENANVSRALDITGPDRLQLMGAALSSISQNPFIGYGMDLLPGVPETEFTFEGQAIHNAVLRGWLYGGIIVFVGVVYAYLYGLGLALAALWRYLNGSNSLLPLALAISTIGWMVNDMTQPVFYQRFTWLTVAILFGLMVRDYRSVLRPAPLADGGSDVFIGNPNAFPGE